MKLSITYSFLSVIIVLAGRIVQPLLLKKGIEKKIPVIVGLDPVREKNEILKL